MNSKKTPKLIKNLTATEKLLYNHFGIKDFQDVIKYLNKQPEKIFTDNFYIEKKHFIEKIEELNKSIISSSDTYSEVQEMMKSGSVVENFAKNHYGAFHKNYVQTRKRLVYHLSFFYKKI